MAHRTYLFALVLLSLYSVNAFIPAEWLKSIWDFHGEIVDSSSDAIQLKTLKVSPDPIKIPGNVTVSLIVAIGSALPTDLHASLTLEKKVGSFYIKVPCEHDIGSCNYGNICSKWAEFCSKYFEKFGFPCTCPIPANTYSVPDAIIDATKKLPSQADGEFKLQINIAGGSGHLGCIKLQFKLKN